MVKRYIVILNNSNAESNDKFQKYIEDNKLSWWFWVGDTWLLKDYAGGLNSVLIRDKLNEFYPNVRNLVIELRGDSSNDTWNGFGPSGKENNMFNWLAYTWSKD